MPEQAYTTEELQELHISLDHLLEAWYPISVIHAGEGLDIRCPRYMQIVRWMGSLASLAQEMDAVLKAHDPS